MTYTPKYTSTSKVASELQITLSNNSVPTTTEVTNWIEEIEGDIDAKWLGSHASNNTMVDVPETREDTLPPVGTISWFEGIADPRLSRYLTSGMVVNLPMMPIVSVSNVTKRTSTLGDTEAWEAVTEGLGNNATDGFIIMKRRYKTGLLGIALYFYAHLPYTGYQRLKVTYNYGYNIPTVVLSEYATLKTCTRVLFGLSQTTNPSGMRQFIGGDLQTYVPTQYQGKWNELRLRIAEWEKKWLDKPIAVGVF